MTPSHALLYDIFRQKSVKEIADTVGLSPKRLYQWAEAPAPQGSGTINPLDRVAALLKATGDERIAAWICQNADGFFVKNPSDADLRKKELADGSTALIRQFADMIATLAETARDGQITEEESQDIRNSWDKIKGVTETYVRLCEQGYFKQKEQSATSVANEQRWGGKSKRSATKGQR